MKTQTAPRTRRAAVPRGGGSELDDEDPRAAYIENEAGDLSGRDGSPIGGRSVRAWSWDEALLFIGESRHEHESEASSHGSGLPSPGIKFVHGVPASLSHIGCMWLADGREDRRCGKPPAWTMGANLNLARVYCEMHGRAIELRRAQIRTGRNLRRRATGRSDLRRTGNPPTRQNV